MDKVEITKDEYYRLKVAELELDLLNAAGVDNWQGYGEGFEDFAKLKEEIKKEIYG